MTIGSPTLEEHLQAKPSASRRAAEYATSGQEALAGAERDQLTSRPTKRASEIEEQLAEQMREAEKRARRSGQGDQRSQGTADPLRDAIPRAARDRAAGRVQGGDGR